jgi:hypothetical protein
MRASFKQAICLTILLSAPQVGARAETVQAWGVNSTSHT